MVRGATARMGRPSSTVSSAPDATGAILEMTDRNRSLIEIGKEKREKFSLQLPRMARRMLPAPRLPGDK